jgi:hypothetical protein
MEKTPDRTSTPRLSLRDYQRELAERLRLADSARSASKLGVQVGSETWLIDLVEAGEVIPVPPITPVPLTRPWFRGVANVRGNLYSVVDFAAFVGVGAVEVTERARLVLLGERLRCSSTARSGCAIRTSCARGRWQGRRRGSEPSTTTPTARHGPSWTYGSWCSTSSS